MPVLHRLAHGLAIDHAGGQALDGVELGGGDGALAVDGLSERVDDAADEGFAHRHRHDALGAADFVAFLDLGVIAEEYGADLVLPPGFMARPLTPWGNSMSSPAMTFSRPWIRAMPSPTEITEPTSATFDGAFVILDFLAKDAGYFVPLESEP